MTDCGFGIEYVPTVLVPQSCIPRGNTTVVLQSTFSCSRAGAGQVDRSRDTASPQPSDMENYEYFGITLGAMQLPSL